MRKLAVLNYMALSTWTYAQEASCVSRPQFLKGEFTADSVACDPLFAGPLKYCNPRDIDGTELQSVSAALDFFEYFFVGPYGNRYRDENDISEMVAWADGMRLHALLDEETPENATRLFYILATAILSAYLSELAIKADVDANFQMLISRELEGQYFAYGLPKSVLELERVFECAARCGDTGANMEKLTRSSVFSACTGGVVTSTY